MDQASLAVFRRRRPLSRSAAFVLSLLFAAAGCTPEAYVTRRVADVVSSRGGVFASDDDPQLVRDATPFALKSTESLLTAQPRHRGLLLSLASGFTQYAVAFVWQDAVESADPAAGRAGKERAARLCLRGRDYALRALEVDHPGFGTLLAADPAAAVRLAGRDDVPFLYWAGAAWSFAVLASGGEPALLAELPRCEALMRRALALQEDYAAGAIHEFFIAWEGGRSETMGGSAARARQHFARAMELAAGRRVSPLLALAETVAVRVQDRREFLDLLERTLAFDARRLAPEYRQANLAAQRRAAWLKRRVDDLFLD